MSCFSEPSPRLWYSGARYPLSIPSRTTERVCLKEWSYESSSKKIRTFKSTKCVMTDYSERSTCKQAWGLQKYSPGFLMCRPILKKKLAPNHTPCREGKVSNLNNLQVHAGSAHDASSCQGNVRYPSTILLKLETLDREMSWLISHKSLTNQFIMNPSVELMDLPWAPSCF